MREQQGQEAEIAGSENESLEIARLWGEESEHGFRVRKRRFLFLFILLTLLLSIGSVQVFHSEESGFVRLQRLYGGSRGIFSGPTSLPVNERELANELGVPIEDVVLAADVIDRYTSRLESRALRPLDWALRVPVGNYTILLSYRIFINMAISGLIAWALYSQARDKAASQVIDRQNSQLKALNETLERRVEEAQKYLDDLRDTQSKLVMAEKLASIGRMSATLAHEIRNPMSIIMSAAGIAADDLPPGSPPSQAVDLIRAEVTRLDGIISELLNFARPKPARLARHNLNELLQGWMHPIQEELTKAGVRLRFVPDRSIRPVITDSDQLYQVLLNVVWNARDALKETPDPEITILTEEAGPRGAFLIVRDNGPGMDREILEQIYEPFFTTKTHGTGLGLPVVEQLMEAMGGKAIIESEIERGTTVSLVLRAAVDAGGAEFEQTPFPATKKSEG